VSEESTGQRTPGYLLTRRALINPVRAVHGCQNQFNDNHGVTTLPSRAANGTSGLVLHLFWPCFSENMMIQKRNTTPDIPLIPVPAFLF